MSPVALVPPGDAFVLKCRRCGAPARWFDWIRASDGAAMTQPLCDGGGEALCVACALKLDPAREICACQHCQREIDKLRRRN